MYKIPTNSKLKTEAWILKEEGQDIGCGSGNNLVTELDIVDIFVAISNFDFAGSILFT